MGKREVCITDEVFQAVYSTDGELLRDAMDLSYLTGQRPGDVLELTQHNIKDGLLIIKQGKTAAPLRFFYWRCFGGVLLTRIAKRKEA